jgi:asparagine synthase (glutamine-hydrolysing)
MFAGCIDKSKSSTTGDALVKLASCPDGLAHIPFDDSAYWTDTRLTLVQQRRWNTPESHLEKGILVHIDSQTRVCAWARIDNRTELLDKLPAHLHKLAETDTGLILGCYLHWQRDCCQHLVGDFAFAIVDNNAGGVYLARDHMGVRPLYYYWDGEIFLFATSIAIINGISGLDLKLSEEWMARYLLNCSQDWELCAYEKIKKVAPAHFVEFSGTTPQAHRYFAFSEESSLHLASDQDYVAAYREVLHEAVRCRLRSNYALGSELSGGLDSSTVTALAARFMKNPAKDLHSFSFALCELDPECILGVSQMSPMRMTHLATSTQYFGEKIAEVKDAFLQSSGVPIEHMNAISYWLFYEEAQRWDIRTKLSGFGGDEFTTNSGSLALVEFWLNRHYELLRSRLPGNSITSVLRAIRWVYRYYRWHNTSENARNIINVAKKQWQNRLVDERLCDKYDLENKSGFLSRYDSGWANINQFTLGNRWSPFMTARLENCSLMAARHGIEYRWPLMDVRLLKLFLSIPAEQKFGPEGISRYLHRRAIADDIPEQIAWKAKYMGEPIRKLTKSIIENEGLNILNFSDLDLRLQEIVSESRLQSLQSEFQAAGDKISLMQMRRHFRSLEQINLWLQKVKL